VLKLTQNLRNSGRTITCDNFFTSVPLAEKLFTERTYLVGTIRPNRKGVPQAFVSEKFDKDFAGFIFRDALCLLKYQSKVDKCVYLLSSKHPNTLVDKLGTGRFEVHESFDFLSNLTLGKPKMVMDYNASKGGVDSFDQMIDHYSVKQKSKRWPMRIFYWMLDSAAFNAFRLFMVGSEKTCRNVFLSNLATDLMKPQQEKLANSGHWYSKTVASILKLTEDLRQKRLGEKRNVIDCVPNECSTPKRARCGNCPRDMDKKSNIFCYRCKKPLCLAHRVIVCQECIL